MPGDQTVVSKDKFKILVNYIGVTIKILHSDNGIFTTKQFQDSFKSENITYSGVNKHNQME